MPDVLKQLAVIGACCILVCIGCGAIILRSDHQLLTSSLISSLNCGGNDSTEIATLIARGADAGATSYTGLSALMAMSRAQDPEGFELVLRKTRRINAFDHDGLTALHHAILSKSAFATKALIQAGANVNARSHGTGTPLMCAAAIGNEEAVDTLLTQGAIKEATDDT